MRERPSPNHDARQEGRAVDILLLHYTGMASAGEALERLCDPAAKVSAHYMIDEDGTVWRLVPEARRAWHAGAASRSEEHTSELQSLMRISYAVFCLKKKTTNSHDPHWTRVSSY